MMGKIFGLLILLGIPFSVFGLEWRVNGRTAFDGVLILETTSEIGKNTVDLQVAYLDSWPSNLSHSNELIFSFGSSLTILSAQRKSLVADLSPQGLDNLVTGPRSGLTRLILEKSRFGWSRLARDIVIPLSTRRYANERSGFASLIQVGHKASVKISDLNYDNLQLLVFGTETSHSDWVVMEDLSSDAIAFDQLGPIEVAHAHLAEYRVGAKSPCGRELTDQGGKFSLEIDLARPSFKKLCVRLNRELWVDDYQVQMRFHVKEVRPGAIQAKFSKEKTLECTPESGSAHQADYSSAFTTRKDFWNIFLEGDCLEKIVDARRGWSLGRGKSLEWKAQVFFVPKHGNLATFPMANQEIGFVQLPKLDWFPVEFVPN